MEIELETQTYWFQMIIIIDISSGINCADQPIYWSRNKLALLIRDKMNLASLIHFKQIRHESMPHEE